MKKFSFVCLLALVSLFLIYGTVYAQDVTSTPAPACDAPDDWGSTTRVKYIGDTKEFHFTIPEEGGEVKLKFFGYQDYDKAGCKYTDPADMQDGESGNYESPCGGFAVSDGVFEPRRFHGAKACVLSPGEYTVTFTKGGDRGESLNVGLDVTVYVNTSTPPPVTKTPTETPVPPTVTDTPTLTNTGTVTPTSTGTVTATATGTAVTTNVPPIPITYTPSVTATPTNQAPPRQSTWTPTATERNPVPGEARPTNVPSTTPEVAILLPQTGVGDNLGHMALAAIFFTGLFGAVRFIRAKV